MSHPSPLLVISFAAIPLAIVSTNALADPDLTAMCIDAVAGKYGGKAHVLQVSPVISAVTGFAVDGVAELGGEGKRRFTCTFNQDRMIQGVVIRKED